MAAPKKKPAARKPAPVRKGKAKAKAKVKAKAKAAPLTKGNARKPAPPGQGAPAGNQFWKLRAKHGRDKLFATPEILLEACVEYFEAVEANPLREQKVFQHQGQIIKTDMTKMRAMTIGGLCIFLNIDKDTWGNYRKEKDFVSVVTRVEEIIRDQKFSGAAADLLNANIIARDLGLAEKQIQEVTTETQAQRLRRLMNEGGGDVSSPQ